jgi:hypothetical protein
MTILRMVIIDFIVIIVFIAIIFVLFNYCDYCHYGDYCYYLYNLPYCIYSEPHPAPIACALPGVAGSARKGVAHLVQNSFSVTDRYQRKFAQDTLNGNDLQDRFLVVKLVYHPRSNRFQPSYNKEINNSCNKNYNMHKCYNATYCK